MQCNISTCRPFLDIGDPELDAVVVGLDEEALVVDLSALLRVEVGPVQHHAALHPGFDGVDKLLVVPEVEANESIQCFKLRLKSNQIKSNPT